MANTYTLIQSYTVGAGGAASIEFTSIPSTYTDIVVVASTRADNAGTQQDVNVQLNGNTSSIYSERYVYGNGSSAASGSASSRSFTYNGATDGNTATSNTFNNYQIYIPNYTSSNNKSMSWDTVLEQNGTAAWAGLGASLFASTSTISSFKMYPGSGNFVQYSTAYLYGIKNS